MERETLWVALLCFGIGLAIGFFAGQKYERQQYERGKVEFRLRGPYQQHYYRYDHHRDRDRDQNLRIEW
jgi:hypothetical protein